MPIGRRKILVQFLSSIYVSVIEASELSTDHIYQQQFWQTCGLILSRILSLLKAGPGRRYGAFKKDENDISLGSSNILHIHM